MTSKSNIDMDDGVVEHHTAVNTTIGTVTTTTATATTTSLAGGVSDSDATPIHAKSTFSARAVGAHPTININTLPSLSTSTSYSTSYSPTVTAVPGGSTTVTGATATASDGVTTGAVTGGRISMSSPSPVKMTQRGLNNNDLPTLHECLFGKSSSSTSSASSSLLLSQSKSQSQSSPSMMQVPPLPNLKTESCTIDSSIIDTNFSFDNNNNNDNEIDSSNNTNITKDNNDNNNKYYRHDIDIEILRKLCSYGSGIPEEEEQEQEQEEIKEVERANNFGEGVSDDGDGSAASSPASSSSPTPARPNTRRSVCYRGIAWRVLLNQLPTRDVHMSWSKLLPWQRTTYQELVEQYLDHASDPGSQLKKYNNNSDNNNKNRQQRKNRKMSNNRKSFEENDSNSDNNDESINDDVHKEQQQQEQQELESSLTLSSIYATKRSKTSFSEDDNNDNDNDDTIDIDSGGLNFSNSVRRTSSTHICVTEDIYNEFPSDSPYREEWKNSGITLNKGESAAALGYVAKIQYRLNLLSLP